MSVRACAEITRRFLVLLAVALWFGGFTFYSLVVIHTGHRVFGSQREVGFLTKQVTRWLNWIGVVTLLVLVWNTLVAWRAATPGSRWILFFTLLVMGSIEAGLFRLHPMLDALLDVPTHRILDHARFTRLHHLYINLSTAQWVATMAYLWTTLVAWQRTRPESRHG